MASTISLRSGQQDYWKLVRDVAEHGDKRSPRGHATRDVGPTLIQVDDPVHSLPVGCGRGVKPAIGAIEACQLIGAFSDPDLVLRISPNFAPFMDDGFFWGAYGARIGAQMTNIVRKLEDDPSTRQAVVTLWHPAFDNQPGKHDYPCTVGFQFMIDDQLRLCMNTVMRSNDVWLGFAYDLFQFTQLQLTLANVLDLPPGPYTHMAWSLHLYEKHLADVEKLHEPGPPAYHPHGFGRHGMNITEAMNRAFIVTTRQPASMLYDQTPSEDWYRDVLFPYVFPEHAPPSVVG